MPGDLSIEALGVPFRLEFGPGIDEKSASHLGEIWSAAVVEPVETARVYRVSIHTEGQPLPTGSNQFVGRDLRSLESNLSSRLTLAAIEERKHDLVMLHGCAVARDDGSVYAFVGPSGRGKSTLARSLAQVARYITDETVGIDEDGRVLPHPKPLSIIDRDAPDGLKTQVSPANLGLLQSDNHDLRIARIFLLDRHPDVDGVVIEPIGLTDSLEQLVPQLSYLPSLPRPLHRIAELYDRVGGFAVLRYSEADDITAAFTAGSLDGRAHSMISAPPPVDMLTERHQESVQAEGFRRLPAIDALSVEDRLCLLHGSSVTVLDGIGPTIWALTETSTPITELIARVVELHGEPPVGDAAALVSETVMTLVEAGVIERSPRLEVAARS
jgi:energy-coupling factor transporter ATP-binding protein EcfA2